MIHHVSIGVCHPEAVASAFAELLGGFYRPFLADGFMVHCHDEHGTSVEVYPSDTLLTGNEWPYDKGPKQEGLMATHFALSVDLSVEEAEAIAERAGWDCYRKQRGGFPVLEMWIDKRQMFEVLSPEYAQQYIAVHEDLSKKALAAKA